MSALGSMGSWSDDYFDQRLRVFGIVMAGFFALFLVRLFQLQVVAGDQHLQRSQRNSIRTERIASPRGEIVDREGRVLASTRPAFELEVVPSELRDKERTFALLSALMQEPPEHVREAVGAARGRARFQAVRLADDLSFEQLARVESHRYALPGVLTVEQAASAIADGIEEDRFLILTHPEVLGFFQNKATDYGRWLGGMRRVRDRLRAGGFLELKS